MQRIFYPTAGRRIGDKGRSPRTRSRLARRTMMVTGIALAGALLGANAAQAKARPCSLLVNEQECCSSEECSGHVLGNKASETAMQEDTPRQELASCLGGPG